MKKFGYLFSFALIVLFSCNKKDGSFGPSQEPPIPDFNSTFRISGISGNYLNAPIFGTDTVKIIPFSYRGHHFSGDNFFANTPPMTYKEVSGTYCKFISDVDALPVDPEFKWKDIGNKLVCAAIFDENIRINDRKIQNVSNIIWTWNNSFDSGYNNNNIWNIKYSYGKMVKNGNIVPGSPTNLEYNKGYVFAVWYWNDDGTEIVASSRPIPFFVTDKWTDSIKLTDPRQMLCLQPGVQVFSSSAGFQNYSNFPIKSIVYDSSNGQIASKAGFGFHTGDEHNIFHYKIYFSDNTVERYSSQLMDDNFYIYNNDSKSDTIAVFSRVCFRCDNFMYTYAVVRSPHGNAKGYFRVPFLFKYF